MNRTRAAIAAAVLLVTSAAFWLYRRAEANEGETYRFATVERGDLQATVSATGTLNAVRTVQVGTQVSGQVSAIHVDFNDRVAEGQLIARIDPTLQQQAVRDAQASLERGQAELDRAEREFRRNRQLYERKVLTESEFDAAEYDLAVARADVKSAQVGLERARQNLAYTSIYAPIDGVVVERNVDVGQTVAASLSAPQLFLIANDLSRMQILASVDESDIGLIREGQPVRFTVQPYPDETFTGTVRQVRLQSTTLENVVNYTVVIAVENPAGKLLPGMTATVDFLTASAPDALTVPNAALRFRPTEAMLATVREGGRAQGPMASDSGPSRRAVRGAARAAEASAGDAPASPAGLGAATATRLWYVDAEGRLGVTRVRAGLSDGERTEVQGAGVREGMQVIVGVIQSEGAAGAASPFQAPAQQSGPPFRGGGF